jgi:hypothetical protein
MDAMECKSSAMSFYQKLKRFTNNICPSTVPVRLVFVRTMISHNWPWTL